VSSTPGSGPRERQQPARCGRARAAGSTVPESVIDDLASEDIDPPWAVSTRNRSQRAWRDCLRTARSVARRCGLLALYTLLQPLFGLVAVLGIPDVDPPAVQTNRVDRPSGLEQQVDRVADLVLAAVRGLDQFTEFEAEAPPSRSAGLPAPGASTSE